MEAVCYDAAMQVARKFEPEAIGLLKELVEMDRGSGNARELRQAAIHLSKTLEEMGCAAELLEDETYGPTLVARIQGSGKAKILIFAHMDTVWPIGTCGKWPFEIRDDYAYGPGTSDNTSGAVAAIFTLKTMLNLRWNSFGELIFLFNPDEEISSPSSSRWIRQIAEEADLCICMECASNRDDYITRRAGGVYFEMRVSGVSAHAGVSPQEGRNAIAEMAYKLAEINLISVTDAYGSISKISGGNGPCIVADNAYCMFRFRVDTEEAERAVVEAVERVAKKTYIDGTKTELSRLPMGLPPLVKNPGIETYTDLLDTLAESIGRPMTEAFCGGGADSGTASQSGTPTLCGMGPYGEGYHTPNERFDLRELSPRIALLSVFFESIGRNHREMKGEK